MTKAHDSNETTGAMVSTMCAAGIPQASIAKALGLSEPTLRRHYRHELDNGGILATAKVAANLFRMATGEGREAVTAAIFWMKTRAGWKETAAVELSGKDGAPFEKITSAMTMQQAADAYHTTLHSH